MKKLDKAIERYKDNADYERTHGNLQGCLEFRQLSKWLKELRAYREIYRKEHVDDCLRAEKTILTKIKNAPATIMPDEKFEIITRGNCMMCGKELTEGLFFCKECESKAIQGKK